MCFVWIWEQTEIISLYIINWLVFIILTECVCCAVRTESVYIYFRLIFVFEGLISMQQQQPTVPTVSTSPPCWISLQEFLLFSKRVTTQKPDLIITLCVHNGWLLLAWKMLIFCLYDFKILTFYFLFVKSVHITQRHALYSLFRR